MTKTSHYHLIIGVSDLCCKVVNRKSTCKTSCLLTAEHCLLAKVKVRWEEGNLPLRDDYGILRTLKATLAAFKKQRGRKRLTVEEKMPLIDQMTSSTLDLSPRDWKKLINQDRSLSASWRQEKIQYLEDFLGTSATRTSRLSDQGFVKQRLLVQELEREEEGEGVSLHSSP